MSRRSTKSPVEIASDLGAKAHDLYTHGDTQARAALRVIAQVNPEMMAWLRDRLLDITEQRPLPQNDYAKRLLIKEQESGS
jgi:hypothetical protein